MDWEIRRALTPDETAYVPTAPWNQFGHWFQVYLTRFLSTVDLIVAKDTCSYMSATYLREIDRRAMQTAHACRLVCSYCDRPSLLYCANYTSVGDRKAMVSFFCVLCGSTPTMGIELTKHSEMTIDVRDFFFPGLGNPPNQERLAFRVDDYGVFICPACGSDSYCNHVTSMQRSKEEFRITSDGCAMGEPDFADWFDEESGEFIGASKEEFDSHVRAEKARCKVMRYYGGTICIFNQPFAQISTTDHWELPQHMRRLAPGEQVYDHPFYVPDDDDSC